MANVTNLRPGSKGEDVKKLQQTLINEGYNVGGTKADGVYGKNTLAAVKQYQKDKGLTVDGVAGKNTLGSLYGTGGSKAAKPAAVTPKTNAGGGAKNADKPAPAAEAPAATDTPETTTLTTGESDAVMQANAMLAQFMESKPGAYQSAWQDDADAYLDQYLNRGPFSYDFNSDALYQQYKDQYIQQGQMAMMDTMGQAAAMTGGYGNSYAQTVGQQAYNQYLGQLNEVMPELYGMAYDRYSQEGQELLNMYGLYMDRDAMDYGRYQDGLDNWYNELDYHYGVSRDAVADSQWQQTYDSNETWRQKEFDYGVERDKVSDSQWQQTYDSNEAWRDKEFNYGVEQDSLNRTDKEKANAKSDLINLITGTGYEATDSELAAAGISREQANSYKKAYSDSQTKTQTQSKTEEPKYTVLDYEEMQKWEKKFGSATSIKDLEKAADQMEQAGVDPQIVATWVDWYADQFKVDETVYPRNYKIYDPEGGGGGGGRMMMATR